MQGLQQHGELEEKKSSRIQAAAGRAASLGGGGRSTAGARPSTLGSPRASTRPLGDRSVGSPRASTRSGEDQGKLPDGRHDGRTRIGATGDESVPVHPTRLRNEPFRGGWSRDAHDVGRVRPGAQLAIAVALPLSGSLQRHKKYVMTAASTLALETARRQSRTLQSLLLKGISETA